MPPVEVINMQRNDQQCCVCGMIDESRWGIPVSQRTGVIVSNDYDGEWSGKPACRVCHKKHEGGAFVGTYPRY